MSFISLPISEWPANERLLWENCRQEGHGFLGTTRLGRLGPNSCKQAMRAYGEWLGWLRNQDSLNDADPVSRLTRERVVQFVKQQHARGVLWRTIADRLQLIMLVVDSFSGGADLRQLKKLRARLKVLGEREPREQKFIVHAQDVFRLGFDLMTEAMVSDQSDVEDLARFSNGMMIALWTALPLRIENFSSLRLDQELLRGDGSWHVRLPAEAAKTLRADYCGLPTSICPFLDIYCDIVRPQLLAGTPDACRRLWLTRHGAPLGQQSIRKRVKRATQERFKRPILPHAFRSIAVTTFVMEEPELAELAPALLGHTSPRTTEDHYIVRQQFVAIHRYHESLERREQQLVVSDRCTIAGGQMGDGR